MPVANGERVRELVQEVLLRHSELNISGISGEIGDGNQPFGFSRRQLFNARNGKAVSWEKLHAIARRLQDLLGREIGIGELLASDNPIAPHSDGNLFLGSNQTAHSQIDANSVEPSGWADIKLHHGFNKSGDNVELDTTHNGGFYDVFFGTNRRPEVTGGSVCGFDDKRYKELSYGVCRVLVPKSHRIGSTGSGLVGRLVRGDDRLKLAFLVSMEQTEFKQAISTRMLESGAFQKPTLFVHGFNNTFEEAVLRSAQIGHDLNLTGGIGLFSWPSHGKLSKYAADESSMEASKYYLADFIEAFVDMIGGRELNIIAHSMGSRCLLLAMERLAATNSSALQMINQVIFAAADVDQEMMQHLGAHVVKYSNRTTSYSSTKDKAVQISKWLHSFPRVGFCPPVFIMEGVDTVLVNQSDLTLLGHGYVASNERILNDIFQLLSNNSSPEDRFSIDCIEANDVSCWKLSD